MRDDDEWLTIKWLRAKRDQYELSGTPLIFEGIKFLVDVDRRLPKVGPTDATPVSWPGYTHDAPDQADALKQRMIDYAAGDDPKAVFGLKEAATTLEITSAESMERVFRAHLVGKNKDRDWKILWRLAKGESLRKTAKEISRGRRLSLDYETIFLMVALDERQERQYMCSRDRRERSPCVYARFFRRCLSGVGHRPVPDIAKTAGPEQNDHGGCHRPFIRPNLSIGVGSGL